MSRAMLRRLDRMAPMFRVQRTCYLVAGDDGEITRAVLISAKGHRSVVREEGEPLDVFRGRLTRKKADLERADEMLRVVRLMMHGGFEPMPEPPIETEVMP